MEPRSLPKQVSNQHPNLHRFWNQFGFILGGFWEPSWYQMAPKVDAQRYQKNDHLLNRSWKQFSSILGSIWEAKFASQIGLRSHFVALGTQDSSKTPQDPSQDRFLKASRHSQHPHFGAKIYQKSAQERSKLHSKLHLLFDHFLDRFLMDFWWIFGPKAIQNSTKINQKVNPTGPSSTSRPGGMRDAIE